MNWDALGAIAELLGAIAVFLTLAYLTVQVRQNSKALELQNQNFCSTDHASKNRHSDGVQQRGFGFGTQSGDYGQNH